MKIRTLGYGGHMREALNSSIEEVLQNMTKDGVIVDVRIKPFGMVNMPDLRRILKSRYIWAKTLGNPFFDTTYTEAKFMDYLTAHEVEILEFFKRLEKEGVGVVYLMCAEADVNRCHRKVIGQWLKKRGYDVEFDGKLTPSIADFM